MMKLLYFQFFNLQLKNVYMLLLMKFYALSTFVTCSSFSKDFSLNGARVGVMYLGTTHICQMSSKINFLFLPSRNTQFILQQLISDHEWIRFYIALNRQRLTQRYTQVKLALEMIEGIKVRRSNAGFFIWADFKKSYAC